MILQKNKNKKKPIFRNIHTKGYSIGFTWVFGLVTLFGLGILYITFTEVFEVHLVPTIKSMVNGTTYIGAPIDNATSTLVTTQIDKYMDYFHLMPFVLFFMVIVYMIIASIQKERGSDVF